MGMLQAINQSAGAGRTELILVLAVMLVLLIFGIVAVVIFVRTYRKERR